MTRSIRFAAAAAVAAGVLAGVVPQASAETVPTAPSSVTISEVGLTSVLVSFVDRSTNERGFTIQRRPAGGTYTDAGEIRDHRTGQPAATGWAYSRTTTWPSTGGYYCYRVQAWNDAGAGSSIERCPPRADLEFDGGIGLSPSPPQYAQPFTVSWTVCNNGGSPSGPFYDTAQLNSDLTAITAVSSLAPGDCRARSVRFSAGVTSGFHRMDVRLDVFNAVAESDETNNAKARTWLTS